MTRSDSLSLSSYSSWLLPPALVGRSDMSACVGARDRRRRLRRLFESCCTRRPVVTISSVADDKDDEEGCEETSIHDSV